MSFEFCNRIFCARVVSKVLRYDRDLSGLWLLVGIGTNIRKRLVKQESLGR